MRNHEQMDRAIGEAVARSRMEALTRASFLRRSVVGAVGVTSLSGLLAACGSDSGSGGSTTSGSAAASTLKPDISARFDPSVAAGAKPSGLPGSFNYVAFSTDPFWVDFSKAFKQGSDAVGLEFGDANAQGDVAKYLDLVQQQLTRGTAGTFLSPMDPRAELTLAQQGIDNGVYVVALQLNPGITQITENQGTVGRRIGEEAARYINDQLGGRAEVLLFNEGTAIASIKQRWDGVRAALRANAPGARIVKDLTPRNTADDGFKQASSAFAANPDIKVVIGPALATLGAFSALESTGKATDDMYIASVGGTTDELKAIRKGGAYKGSWADPWLLVGYMCALWTRDWLDGKPVPMGVELAPQLLTIDNLQKYADDMADPSGVIADGRVDGYVDLWGTINYATRDQYYRDLWNGATA
jgi:ABC-type sugar transport system substrate-binding protein